MRGTNQKLKALYLKDILEEETDMEHGISMPRIYELLAQKGVAAERRSIYDDLRLLETEYGLPIEHEPGGRTYRLADHYFEFADLKLIIDCISSSKTLTESKSQHLIDKLKMLCSKRERETLFNQIIVTDRAKTQNKEVQYSIDTINKAIANKYWLHFQYFYYNVDKKKVFSFGGRSYHVAPYAMIYVDNNYYLIAFDKHGNKKHYRIDRMTNVSIHYARYNVEYYKSKVDMANYTKYTFSMHGGEIENVTMRFERSLVSMVLDRFGHDTILLKDGVMHFKITQPIAVSGQFFGWMLSFGEKAEIIAPANVRDDMRQHLENALKQYGNHH